MINPELRMNLSRLGLVIFGFIGSVLVFVGLNEYVLGTLFSLIAGAGVFLLLEMKKIYSIIMIIVGIIALLFTILNYLDHGIVALTILYTLITILGIVRGSQAYQTTGPDI